MDDVWNSCLGCKNKIIMISIDLLTASTPVENLALNLNYINFFLETQNQ